MSFVDLLLIGVVVFGATVSLLLVCYFITSSIANLIAQTRTWMGPRNGNKKTN